MKLEIILSAVIIITAISAAYGQSENRTMQLEYDIKLMPSFNDNIEVISNILEGCDIARVSGPSQGAYPTLQECHALLKDYVDNLENLRQKHNATIEMYYRNVTY